MVAIDAILVVLTAAFILMAVGVVPPGIPPAVARPFFDVRCLRGLTALPLGLGVMMVIPTPPAGRSAYTCPMSSARHLATVAGVGGHSSSGSSVSVSPFGRRRRVVSGTK